MSKFKANEYLRNRWGKEIPEPRVATRSFPWRVKYAPGHPSVVGADGKAILSTGNSRSRHWEENVAHCMVASAAPELYDVARAILELPAGTHDLPPHLIEKLRLAVLKADEG